MAEEKILDSEKLEEDQLDNVAGGTRVETYADGNELYKRGLISQDDALSSSSVRDMLHKMGYTGYKDNGGLFNDNVYTDKQGNAISRDQFWKNFDKENGTKIIR